MKKNFFLMSIIAVAAVLCSAGCVIIKEYPPAKENFTVNQYEYELARELITAFVKDDAEKFVSLLPEETRKEFTVESFKNTRKSVIESVGEPISFSYLTALEFTSLTPQVWKVRFRRYNVNRTKEFTSEVLFKVITGRASEKEAVITAFHFL